MLKPRAAPFLIAVAIYSLTLGACRDDGTASAPGAAIKGPKEVTAVPRDLIGDKEEFAEQAAKAVTGDPVAAGRVANYYAFLDPKNPDVDFWIRIAVENGNVEWIDLYAQQLSVRPDIYGCKRAIYWENRAIELSPDRKATYENRIRVMRSYQNCKDETLPKN